MPGHSSTAVPGPDAKPIFDVAAAVSSAEVVPRLVGPLGDFGYVYRGHVGHHLHVVAADDPQWCWWLLFRDALRADEALRARYARTKKVLLPLRQEHLMFV
jgi:GrpB-like predicted nucleotidyltransferase (UPF0157 family)